jgi:hypothetical protein
MNNIFKKFIKRNFINSTVFTIPFLLFSGINHYFNKLKLIFKIAFFSKEISSYNYSLTSYSLNNLIHTIATITKTKFSDCFLYYEEIINNQIIKDIIFSSKIKNYDSRFEFSGRIYSYIIIRLLKPKIIVENGVGIGLNSLLICEAINKNISEGHISKYYGIDINTGCCNLFKLSNYNFAQIFFEDTIQFLSKFDKNIDFYISDGSRSSSYEELEFSVLSNLIDNKSIIVSNKGSFSTELSKLAIKFNRNYITFQENVLNHWYQGSVFCFLY